MQLFFSPRYVLAAHAFDTTRKAAWVAESLRQAPIAGVAIVPPVPLTADEVTAVHAPAYVDAVRMGEPRGLATSMGFRWDPGVWPMVLASNGGVVAAARAALQDGVAGSLSSGLHHARADHGAGFCTFNGLALAARAALDAGARRVLILDLDAHCGGGTCSLTIDRDAIWHVDVAVAAFDYYTPGPQQRLAMVDDAADYLATVDEELTSIAAAAPGFDLCLYNAGMDPFEGCDTGGRHGITTATLAQREELVFGWCRQQRIPVAFVLAGGYTGPRLDEDGLVALHRRTIAAAARHCGRDPSEQPRLLLPPLPSALHRTASIGRQRVDMDASERRRLVHDTFTAFLETAARSVIAGTPSPYLIFEAYLFEEEYVQFKLYGDQLVGEVGSREWTDRPRPFSAVARGFLAASGFGGGGPDCNYVGESLPHDPDYLAGLVESLFSVYELGDCFGLTVKRYDGHAAE